MRINNQIWDYSFSCEWHVFLTVCHAYCTFLPMPTCEFIAYLRNALWSHLYFHKSISIFVYRQHHLFNFTSLWMFQLSGHISAGFHEEERMISTLNLVIFSKLIIHFNLSWLSYDNIISAYLISWVYQSVYVKFIISSMLATRTFPKVRYLKSFIFLLWIRVSSEEGTSKYSTINTRLIEYDTILLVVASIASNCNDSITPCRQLLEM